ncbi:hypothetical protein GCM10022399_43870 [Terrabacter ginsenosidimutans]|uniref:Uncharacterized protein n=1 Tax=Terrabacter ginsenosidimutans TaxID=490575 RepID=A0ABP7ET55_9MICO
MSETVTHLATYPPVGQSGPRAAPGEPVLPQRGLGFVVPAQESAAGTQRRAGVRVDRRVKTWIEIAWRGEAAPVGVGLGCTRAHAGTVWSRLVECSKGVSSGTPAQGSA